MAPFALKRLGFLVPQLLLVVVTTFVLLRVMPADPAAKIAGVVSTPEALAQARATLGLDHSLWVQLTTYLADLLRWDFGQSWATGTSVGEEIVVHFAVTLQLVGLAFIVALAIAIPLGRAAAARPGGKADRGAQTYSLFAGAQPDFWWGLVFVYLFAVKFNVFPIPTGGLLSGSTIPPETVTHIVLIDSLLEGNLAAFWDAIMHLVLPVLTLAFVLTGPLVRMTRQSVLAVATSAYVLHARAMGLPKKSVRRMMLRNSLAPVVTLSGILFGFMLGGAVLVEYVFALNGIGTFALNSVLNLDYPAVQGSVIVMTTFSLLIYLMMDLIYAAMDPRVREGMD